MKDYGMPFKNAAIDRLGSKFGKDKPTHQDVDFKANAEKRVADRVNKNFLTVYKETNANDNNTKIASLKNPQSKTYVSMTENNKPLKGKDVYLSGKGVGSSSVGANSDAFWSDAAKNPSTTSYFGNRDKFVNTQHKMKTLAPSYVDPKGPATLQGVKKKK